MIVSFLGAYDPAYPRNAILRRGLELNGASVQECRLPPSIKFWMRYPLAILRYSRRIAGSDVIFVPEFRQKDVPLGRLFGLLFHKRLVFDPLAARYETKIIDWRRRKPSTVRAWWNFRIDLASFGLSGLILADTKAHKDYFCRTYGVAEDKVAIVPVGYDDLLFKPEASPSPKAKDAPFEVLFFGSFLPLHGAESIIEAAAMLSKKDPTIHFRFIGSGQTLERVRLRADSLALRNAEFTGWLRYADLPTRIAAADVCLGIFGTTEKARRVVPHKVFQALGMKKPVITARTPAAEEFFHHKKDIYFCDPPYPKNLAAAILSLKADARLRRGLAEHGWRLVRDRYSPRPLGRLLLDILESRAERKPRGHK
jgi:glycosyltransferase involved in cell wall biosynthesis